MSATKKVIGARGGLFDSQQSDVPLRTPWPWPQAALVIVLLSLLLWGGIAAIALVAFN